MAMISSETALFLLGILLHATAIWFLREYLLMERQLQEIRRQRNPNQVKPTVSIWRTFALDFIAGIQMFAYDTHEYLLNLEIIMLQLMATVSQHEWAYMLVVRTL
jgi:hypothetical protein